MRRINAASAFTVVAAMFAACGSPTQPGPVAPAGPVGTLVTLVDVRADVNVTEGSTSTSENFLGQSVTVPAGNSFTGVRFHWYTRAGEPTAFGTLYLLDREFLDTPASLGTSTPGFVAASEGITDGQYIFAAGVALSGGRRYWFYTDSKNHYPSPGVVTSFNKDTYPGGDMYITGMPGLAFRKAPASWLWTGSGYVVPPPGTFVDANFRLQAFASQ